MKKGILNKLTIVDYIIIIAVICAVVFAFIHITTDDSNDTKTSSYDSSTMNKIVENYLKLYLEGNVVETMQVLGKLLNYMETYHGLMMTKDQMSKY